MLENWYQEENFQSVTRKFHIRQVKKMEAEMLAGTLPATSPTPRSRVLLIAGHRTLRVHF